MLPETSSHGPFGSETSGTLPQSQPYAFLCHILWLQVIYHVFLRIHSCKHQKGTTTHRRSYLKFNQAEDRANYLLKGKKDDKEKKRKGNLWPLFG
jgi:hypothetical protein